jgi:hypothetical protein
LKNMNVEMTYFPFFKFFIDCLILITFICWDRNFDCVFEKDHFKTEKKADLSYENNP